MNRTQKAIDFITTCCKSVGTFRGNSDVYLYLKETALEMSKSKPSVVFPSRYIEHVSYAINMVASNLFLSPPSAIASVYLATRFEFYFRILSGKLNGDGTWISKSEQTVAQAAIRDDRLKHDCIWSVSLAYKIMKLNQSSKFVQICTELDDLLYSTPITVVGNKKVIDIGDRIKFGRDVVGHGHWEDISAEAIFYGLMTALVFYNQK